MKLKIGILLILLLFISCQPVTEKKPPEDSELITPFTDVVDTNQPAIENNQLEDNGLNTPSIEEEIVEGGLILVDSGDDALLGDVYVINPAEGNTEKLLDSEENGFQHFGYANWSPDGTKIVFSALGPPWEIMTANADGSEMQSVPNTTGGQYPQWSPDGKKIAFSIWNNNADIYVINADGSNLVNLTEDFAPKATDPSWSPDGLQLVFHAAESGEDFELYTIMLNGLAIEQITDNDDIDWAANWSPNGQYIAYLHRSEGEYNEINVIDLDSGNISQRTSKFAYPDFNAAPGVCWMPDSKRLVMVSEGSVYISRQDGGVIFDEIWQGKEFTSFPGCP